MLAIVRHQRRSRPVALLTNATTRLPSDLARLGLDRELDHVFNSAEVGVAKPESRIFELLCAALDMLAKQCTFVDDTAANVAAAGQLGFTTHHYQSASGLAHFLAMTR